MKHLGDITKLNGAEIPLVDVITGGSPCQDLSVANGNREGLAGERSGLFMEQIRVVKEMRDASRRTDKFIRPRYMVWENVPGAFSSNKGKDFQAVLTETVRVVYPECPDVPLPAKGGWSKSGCLMGIGETGQPFSIAWRVHDAQFWGVPQRRRRISLLADYGGLSAPEILFEREGVQWSANEGEAERKETASCIGESADETANDRNVAGTLDSSYHKGCGERQGIERDVVYDARGNGDGRGYPTITGDHNNRVTDYTVLCVGNGQLNQMSMADRANTLDTMHDQQAIITGGNEPVVRRLTPLECERLQGFPDGWTDIGDWTDSSGRIRKTSDSARYRSIGNSIALPFWFYLLRRISAQYERQATLGSLFDGISGFPLCWERCNGKGTAIWSSEVDDFCIAVAKRHFPEEGEEK